MKIIYQSNDGKQFDTEKECKKYEKDKNYIPEAYLTNDHNKIESTIVFLNSNIQRIANTGSSFKDFKHYCFETLIDLFYDSSFWEWYNKNNKGE